MTFQVIQKSQRFCKNVYMVNETITESLFQPTQCALTNGEYYSQTLEKFKWSGNRIFGYFSWRTPNGRNNKSVKVSNLISFSTLFLWPTNLLCKAPGVLVRSIMRPWEKYWGTTALRNYKDVWTWIKSNVFKGLSSKQYTTRLKILFSWWLLNLFSGIMYQIKGIRRFVELL